MVDAAASDDGASEDDRALPVAAIAARLVACERARSPTIYLARNERRADLLARIARGFAPSLAVLAFPAWDCVPYDRAAPSRAVMGRRIKTLQRLATAGDRTSLLVATPAALAQRLPPRSLWKGAELRLHVGDALSVGRLEDYLRRTGYILDERVDEAGEAAIRGAVIDLFPAGAEYPIRIEHADGRVTSIRRYDPASQRTLDDVSELQLLPASEVVLPDAAPEGGAERFAGIEHFLPDCYDATETLFDYMPAAHLVVDPEAQERYGEFWAQVGDAYATRRGAPGQNGGRAPLPPERLYLDPGEWEARLGRLRRLDLNLERIEAVPRFARERDPGGALQEFLSEHLRKKRRLVFAAADPRRFARRVRTAIEQDVQSAPNWPAVLAAQAATALTLPVAVDAGFVDREHDVVLIGAADLLGSRAENAGDAGGARNTLAIGEIELRPGDLVIHIDHGMATLKGIETMAAAGEAAADAIVLEFADETKLLLPIEEMGKIWRYGGDAKAVSLDKLGGATWPKRRAALEADVAETAAKLVALTAARAMGKAEKLTAPRRAYERFAAGFAYAETADQAQAIEEVLDDLASGWPMDRLVCGDVGFGKTEVALRAAAAAVLAGKQVAVVAPTTVLVRQHVQTFRRRFAGIGVEVAHLSRLVKAAEARAVKQGLAAGDTPLVIGTQALAGKGVRFKHLGLLVIDEEQRFGAKQKQALRALGQGLHVLTLTATPIPRTFEGAIVGLQDLSIIDTPPAQRQPVRTFLSPFDAVTVRAALLRERARGGQSFVVCPRIEDMAPMAARLTELAPELQVVQAHGKLPAEEIDAVMVDFADGIGDVLLATNIIESGLDVPRANTILIWRADRFGLAQLHQLRGRVGRGRARGTAYLLTDPAAKLAKATEQRLRTLEALDRLGAGFAVSGRDLDQRGAGDLLGEEQAGHVKLIGIGLYHHLLQRALAAAKGEPLEEDWTPLIRLGLDAAVPDDYVPEPEIRIALYARLARPGDEDDPGTLAEEIADRFGPMPEAMENLLALAYIRKRARRLGIEKLDAGPAALAASFRPGAAVEAVKRMKTAGEGGPEWRGDRLVWPMPSETGEKRRKLVGAFLDRIAGKTSKKSIRRREPAAALAD